MFTSSIKIIQDPWFVFQESGLKRYVINIANGKRTEMEFVFQNIQSKLTRDDKGNLQNNKYNYQRQ